MTDAAWLVVAIAAGLLFAVFFVKRELWIHRRRRARRERGRGGGSGPAGAV